MSADRFPTKEKASIEIYGRSGTTIANLKNLSQTGACLEYEDSEFQLSEGDLIRMTVFLKSINRKHRVNAEVVWKNGSESGIQFISQDQLLDKIVTKDADS
ncbi:MAG: hypothetical protein BroJett040_01840 [Oligoflexia bacterium]|nr:MAG: hypothetical protein BroJett040_01840 [Oligoflexia bacterium]